MGKHVQDNDSRLSDTRTPSDNSVTSAKIVDGTIVDGDISGTAAIAQSKVSGLVGDLAAKAPLESPTFTGTVTAPTLNVSGTADTATAASHYYVETATDGVLRPKTLANVQSEIVTNTRIQSAVVSPTAAGSTGVRKITMSTSAPTGGADGDVWLVYV